MVSTHAMPCDTNFIIASYMCGYPIYKDLWNEKTLSCRGIGMTFLQFQCERILKLSESAPALNILYFPGL